MSKRSQINTTINKKQKFTVLLMVTTVCVLLLHAISGWSIATMKSPLLKPIEIIKEKTIEITLLNLEEAPEPPKLEIKPTPKVIPKPVIKAKLKPIVKKVKPQPIVKPKVVKKQPIKQFIKTQRLKQIKPKKTQAEIEQARKAKANAKKKAQAESTAKANAKKKAQAEATAKDNAKKKAQGKTTNVKLSAGNARWKKQPRFNVKTRKEKSGDRLSVRFRFTVDKQGNITSVSITKSSGNPKIDRSLTKQARRGKFHPFKNKNGVPVSGSVNLPIPVVIP